MLILKKFIFTDIRHFSKAYRVSVLDISLHSGFPQRQENLENLSGHRKAFAKSH